MLNINLLCDMEDNFAIMKKTEKKVSFQILIIQDFIFN